MPAALPVVLLLSTAASAATIAVPGSFATVQDAIDHAVDGDVIQLAPGTYTETITIWGKSMALTLRGDPSNPAATVLDGGGHTGDAVVTLVESNGIVLEGLTITNGHGGDAVGGGLFFANSDAIVRDCVITGNSSGIAGGAYVLSAGGLFQRVVFEGNSSRQWGGGVMVSLGATTTFESCAFRNNHSGTTDPGAGSGGGIMVNDAFPTFVDVEVTDNISGGAGGGVALYGHYDKDLTQVVLRDALIQGNLATPGPAGTGAPEGGGIHIEDHVHATIERSVIRANHADRGGGLSIYRAAYDISDSIVEDNVATVGADAAGTGGGLYAASVNTSATLRGPATVSVSGTVFRRNHAQMGGGLYVQGDFLTDPHGHKGQLTMADVVIADNEAVDFGGGVFLAEAAATLTRAFVIGNQVSGSGASGGGIVTSASSDVTLLDSTIAENQAPGQGGGVYADQGGTLTVTGSRLYRNTAGAAIAGGGLTVGESSSPVAGDGALPVSGTVSGSTFAADDASHEIYEGDCDGQRKSAVVYQNNVIHPASGRAAYFGSCSGNAATAAALNGLGGKGGGNVATTPDIDVFAAVPDTVNAGGTSVLAWCSTDNASGSIAPGVGAAPAHCGTTDVTPASTTVYTYSPGSGADRTATVNVACATLGLPLPMTPTNGRDHVDPSTVTLRWAAATGASSYDVYADGSDDPTTMVASGLSDVTAVVSGLAYGTTYHWKVVAHSSACTDAATSPVYRFDTCPQGQCNFGDDFSDGDASDWAPSGKGTAAVVDGALQIVGNRKLKVMAPSDPIDDGVFEAKLAFLPGAKHEAHILFRVSGKNFGDIALLADRALLKYRGKAGKTKLKRQNDFAVPTDRPFRLKLTLDGKSFRLVIDGAEVLNGSIAGLPPGKVGFLVVKTGLSVDDVSVTQATAP